MSTDSRGVTPYRATHIRFDLAEYTLREPAFALWRDASQMVRGQFGQQNSQNHHYLETNALAIAPWQDDPSNLHEKTDVGASILTLDAWSVIAGMVQRNTFKAPTDLTGVTVDTSVQTTGDPFLVKTVPAGQSWNQSLTADQTAFGSIDPHTTGNNITYDRVAITNSPLPGNQAFVIRAVIPGAAPGYKQTAGAFYFGGPVTNNPGFAPTGVYCLEFMGSGQMNLYMQQPPSGGVSVPRFKQIDSWQGFSRGSGPQIIHCRVWPHYTANGTPTIHFRTDTSDNAPSNGRLLQSYYQGGTNPSVHIWNGWARNGAPVTGIGPMRVDHRRDLRIPFQVSLHRYTAPAYIQDDIFAVDYFPSVTAPLTLVWKRFQPDGTSVDGGLYDANTNVELNQTGGTASSKTYTLNPGQYYYYARFTLSPSPDGQSTPYLYGYKVIRDNVTRLSTPGEFSIPDTVPLAALRELSISGPDKDFTHETASCTIQDPAANLPTLNIRARIRTRIETEYDPTDATKRSVLFDGFIDRADARHKGTNARVGMTGAGAVRQFPSPDWREFQCTFSGIWRRTREKLTTKIIKLFADDDSLDANGLPQTYKVTDVCRKLLYQCGFTADEVDIPDDPRIFRGSGGNGEDTVLQPLQEIGDVVAGFLHDYQGWFLVWDANAGANGMMRAIVPPPLYGPYVPLANFTFDIPSGTKFAHRPESYGSYGWVATGTGSSVQIPTCFIRKRTFQTHVKPPEANMVHVTGNGMILPDKSGEYQLNQWAFNPKSFDFFTDGTGNVIHTADPTHPDYLGEFIPLVVVNFSLGEQWAVDLLCRRLYDQVAHAQKWVMFEAPLCLVIDPNDPLQSNPRPLRYYDPFVITKDGEQTVWITRSCNPYINRKDSIQMMHVEGMAITL